MPNQQPTYLKFDHDEYARTKAPDDFWGQIRRTVRGAKVSDDQIAMIVAAIRSGLDLQPEDTLLDIACGNGALSRLLFDSCSAYLGVDLSEHLISIAKANFEASPDYAFLQQGAAEYVRTEAQPERFSKVICYGSFSYFSTSDATAVLRTLADKFTNVRRVFIGNLPDKERAAEFYKRQPDADELQDSGSQIGTWRTRSEFTRLANAAGWEVAFTTMPNEFYASYYRYDALLTRQA